ncbi:rhodanese-like domain-containing protein [Bacillus sp. FJAT-45037]|uniref:rhodanese-like domain-containing protein n=1 Tax=Bacillus sp. FJAT-45037 TaxID=2011007 RepID=UPI000C238AC2|nr:rhodanese-like domain-containing protein [Bacillus sp. FJAT-45037]
MKNEQDGIRQVEVEELKEMLKQKDSSLIIDVRELDEYEESHIPGVPLIPMHTIPAHLGKLDQTKSYVFVCRSGARSQNVARFLKENGFDHVQNFAGGMLGWDGERATGLEWVVEEIDELYR